MSYNHKVRRKVKKAILEVLDDYGIDLLSIKQTGPNAIEVKTKSFDECDEMMEEIDCNIQEADLNDWYHVKWKELIVVN